MLGKLLRPLFGKRNRAFNTAYKTGVSLGAIATPCTGFNINMATSGLSFDVLGRFLVDGIPVIRVRFFGTATASTQFFFSPSLPHIAIQPNACPGQTWVASVYMALVAGAMPATAAFVVQGATITDGFAEQTSVSVTGITAVLRKLQVAKQLALATVAKARWTLSFNTINTTLYDFTIDIGGIQVEKKPFATVWEPT